MIKLLILFFVYLNFFGADAQISKKPDAASSAIRQGGYQASTLLTSVINKADITLHDVNTPDAQPELGVNNNDLAEMDNDEVLSDVEEDDDDDELMNVNSTNSGDVAMGSASKGGKRLKAKFFRYRKADCEKKRRPHSGKKLKEGKCYKLHKNHFNSFDFCLGKQKKDKKDKDDDDDDESETPSGCRVIIFFDKKCKDEASSTAEGSCKDIGEEGTDDDDDKDDEDDDGKKLYARDLLGKKGKGPKYKSAKFICDGVDTSENTTRTETEDDYSATTTVSSQPIHVADPTGSSPKSSVPSLITATGSTKSATHHSSKTGSGNTTSTSAPEDPDDDDDDDDKEDEKEDDDDEEDEKEDDDDEDKATSTSATQTTKTKKHKTKSHKSKTHTKTKKHHTKTQSFTTESAQATSDSPNT